MYLVTWAKFGRVLLVYICRLSCIQLIDIKSNRLTMRTTETIFYVFGKSKKLRKITFMKILN